METTKQKPASRGIAASIMNNLADGNHDAVTALIHLCEDAPDVDPDSTLQGMGLLFQLEDYGITGSAIWILFSDICDKSTVKTMAVLRAVQLGYLSPSILKSACDRQDRSGKQLINVDKLYKKVKLRLPRFKTIEVD